MKEYMLDDFIKGEVNSDFISVKEYTLRYGHNGKYTKVIRSRFDSNNEKIIKFYLIKLNLIKPGSSVIEISESEVKVLFSIYYPELHGNIVSKFIEGLL